MCFVTRKNSYETISEKYSYLIMGVDHVYVVRLVEFSKLCQLLNLQLEAIEANLFTLKIKELIAVLLIFYYEDGVKSWDASTFLIYSV